MNNLTESFVLIQCTGSSYQPYKADGKSKSKKVVSKLACMSLADNHIGFATIGNKSTLLELPDGFNNVAEFLDSEQSNRMGLRKSKDGNWYTNRAKLTSMRTLTIQNSAYPDRTLSEMVGRFNDVFAGRMEPFQTANQTDTHPDGSPIYAKDSLLIIDPSGVTLVWDNTPSTEKGWRKHIYITPEQFNRAIGVLSGHANDTSDISDILLESDIPDAVRAFNKAKAEANRSEGRRSQGTNVVF